MQQRIFPVTFQDALGTEYGILATDGTRMAIDVRGARLVSGTFEDWELEAGSDGAGRFQIDDHGDILFDRVEVGIPTQLESKTRRLAAMLLVTYALETDRQDLRFGTYQLALEVLDIPTAGKMRRWATTIRRRKFEDALADLQVELDAGEIIHACRNCFLGQPDHDRSGSATECRCYKDWDKMDYLMRVADVKEPFGNPHMPATLDPPKKAVWEWRLQFWNCEEFVAKWEV